MENKELQSKDFNNAKEIIKQTNRIALNIQDNPNYQNNGGMTSPTNFDNRSNSTQNTNSFQENTQDQCFELSLALLTKCKEIVELLQQLFTLSLIKRPEEFNQQKSIKQGSSLYSPIYRLKALTLNNMGCTFLKQNKITESYEYLKQTLDIEMQGNYSKNQIAQTSLNLCCVLSKLNKHKQALNHALRAITMFQEEIQELEKQSLQPQPTLAKIEEEDDYSMDEDEENNEMKINQQNDKNNPLTNDQSLSKIENTILEKLRETQFKLAIAYNNGAIEYEFIGKLQMALDFYNNAANLSEKIYGAEDSKTMLFRNRYQDVQIKQAGSKPKFLNNQQQTFYQSMPQKLARLGLTRNNDLSNYKNNDNMTTSSKSKQSFKEFNSTLTSKYGQQSVSKLPPQVNFNVDNHYHHFSQTQIDREIVRNLKRRPVGITEIKKNYNPVYNNSFGKLRVNPAKKFFFLPPKEDHITLGTVQNLKIMRQKSNQKSRPQSAQYQMSQKSAGSFNENFMGGMGYSLDNRLNQLDMPHVDQNSQKQGQMFDSLDFYRGIGEGSQGQLPNIEEELDTYNSNKNQIQGDKANYRSNIERFSQTNQNFHPQPLFNQTQNDQNLFQKDSFTPSNNILRQKPTRPQSALTLIQDKSQFQMKNLKRQIPNLLIRKGTEKAKQKKIFFEDEIVMNGQLYKLRISEQIKQQLVKIEAQSDSQRNSQNIKPLYVNYQDAMDHLFNSLNRNSEEDLKQRLGNILVEEHGQLRIKPDYRFIFSNQL